MKAWRLLWAVGVLLFAVNGVAVGADSWDGCMTYVNSRVVSSWEYGTYCGATGAGCQFCYMMDGQSYCYSTLPRLCGPFIKPWF